MATILEALQNAKYNLVDNGKNGFAVSIGQNQLSNAVTLLEKDYPLDTEVEDIVEAHGSVDEAPYYQA